MDIVVYSQDQKKKPMVLSLRRNKNQTTQKQALKNSNDDLKHAHQPKKSIGKIIIDIEYDSENNYNFNFDFYRRKQNLQNSFFLSCGNLLLGKRNNLCKQKMNHQNRESDQTIFKNGNIQSQFDAKEFPSICRRPGKVFKDEFQTSPQIRNEIKTSDKFGQFRNFSEIKNKQFQRKRELGNSFQSRRKKKFSEEIRRGNQV